MCATSCEVRTEAIAANIGHVLLLGHRWDGALRVLLDKSLVKEDEVGKSTTRGLVGGLEGFEVGLDFVSDSFGVLVAVQHTSVVTRYDT